MPAAGKLASSVIFRLQAVLLAALLGLPACVGSIPQSIPETPTRVVTLAATVPVQETQPVTVISSATPLPATPTPVEPTSQVEATPDVGGSGFPADIPILAGAEVNEASPGRLVYHTQESPEAVSLFYTEKLADLGWVQGYQGSLPPGPKCACDGGTTSSGEGQLWARLGSSLQVLAAVDAGRTIVTIIYISD